MDSEALTAIVDDRDWGKMAGKLSRSGYSSVEWYLKYSMISYAQSIESSCTLRGDGL